MSTRAADAARWRQHVLRSPDDAIAWHNLASAEGDLGRASAAEIAAKRALALGLAAAETPLVLARALQSLGRLDEAAAAFDDALRRKPDYAEAQRDAAQLVWMRTGSKQQALARIESVLEKINSPALHKVRSVILEFTGDAPGALKAALAGIARGAVDADLLLQAAHLETEIGDPERALVLVGRAHEYNAGERAGIARCDALLALGRANEIDAILAPLIRALPHNQYLLALQATTWRLLDDPRYASLYDYDRLVATRTLATPVGWSSLQAFLVDVANELHGMHRFVTHPFQQSVRGGGQLTFSEDDMRRPLIGALFQSIVQAVHAHLAALGNGNDPMRSRNTGRPAFTGAWSVRLKSGGSHVDHVHPQGWLSSACYLSLPPSIGRGDASHSATASDRAGWLRLGRPGIRTSPAIDADRYVRPAPGLLALFPAYMWHGVEPFAGDAPRLTVAFDVVPG